VAIKVIDLRKEDELSKQFVNEEINILETIKLRNPQNLLRLYDVFKTKNNLYIITEFCEGKDVAKLLRKKKIFG
jgi:serine/threonine protein kinase